MIPRIDTVDRAQRHGPFADLPRSKVQGKAEGSRLYFPALSCSWGHQAPRTTYASACHACTILGRLERKKAGKDAAQGAALKTEGSCAQAREAARIAAQVAARAERKALTEARRAARKADKRAATRAQNKEARQSASQPLQAPPAPPPHQHTPDRHQSPNGPLLPSLTEVDPSAPWD